MTDCGTGRKNVSSQLKIKEYKELYTSIAVIGILVILSYGRILFLHNIFEDDNCWLLSVYASNNLSDFLNTGFTELRRVPQGTFLYYFLKLHKTTDYAYWIWQSIILLIQIAFPIFLCLFAKNLFKGKQPLAFLIACSLIIYPIDTTIPVISNIGYRIGMMFTLISFYLTVKALTDNIRWTFLVFALVLSGISHYIFIEGTVALEPARLAVIGYIFYKQGLQSKLLIKKSLAIWSPFFILFIPLIIYKLVFKPYGVYEGMYSFSLSFVLDWQMQMKLLRMFLLHNWYTLSRNSSSFITFWTILLSISAIVIAYLFFRWSSSSYNEDLRVIKKGENNLFLMLKENIASIAIAFVLGVIFIIPPILMYEVAGRVPIFGVNSRHGIVLQFGYSLLLGSLLYVFYKTFYDIHSKFRGIKNLIIIFIGLGVFYNNINLDLYFDSWQKQKQFWQVFTKQIPSLPEKATFFMDIQPDGANPYSINTDTSYDLELIINLLYARNDDPKFFRRYVVLAPDELQLIEKNIKNSIYSFERISHWGRDIINLNEMVTVIYTNKKLITNREVLLPQQNFSESYDPSFYPLRYKLKEFY